MITKTNVQRLHKVKGILLKHVGEEHALAHWLDIVNEHFGSILKFRNTRQLARFFRMVEVDLEKFTTSTSYDGTQRTHVIYKVVEGEKI